MAVDYAEAFWIFMRAYGWYILLAVFSVYWIQPTVFWVLEKYVLPDPVMEPEKKAEYDRLARIAHEKQQVLVNKIKGEVAEKRAIKEEAARLAKLKELDEQALRYGLRPPGTGHRLGREDELSQGEKEEMRLKKEEMLANQQGDLEVRQEEQAERKAANEELAKQRKLKELDEKALRLGLRPRGTGHKLGAGDEME
eukprot:jgi/Mesen1/4979/ME000248S04263